jgi:hypothetical protein
LADEHGVKVDPSGRKMGFDYFLDHAAENSHTATLFGLEMRSPAETRMRVVPIVAPTPVFAWAVMWRPRIPDSTVHRIVGAADIGLPFASASDPGRVWLPEADRAWLASQH